MRSKNELIVLDDLLIKELRKIHPELDKIESNMEGEK